MRREFQLPADDCEALEARGLTWETVINSNQERRLIIHGYPLPPGYNVPAVTINLWIMPGYPDTALDMVYVYPPIALISGKLIGALASTAFDGQTWQRWSRHRTVLNPWRPGLDNISTHLALVDSWFAREVIPQL